MCALIKYAELNKRLSFTNTLRPALSKSEAINILKSEAFHSAQFWRVHCFLPQWQVRWKGDNHALDYFRDSFDCVAARFGQCVHAGRFHSHFVGHCTGRVAHQSDQWTKSFDLADGVEIENF
jgi:hypothetical protein